MMKNAKTYLTRIQAAATERELTGIEIAFKQDMSINCDDLGKLCRAAEDKRYTLRNNAETLRLKDILFQRTKAEMDAYHDMSRKPESWTAEDIAHQRIRFCSIWQVIEEAELADEYEAWKEANNMDFEEAYNTAIQQKSIAQQNADKQKIENEAAIAKAEADKQVAITNAEAEAQKTSIAADAQAEANRKIAESLSDTLIEYQKIQKWDGKLPTVSGGNALVSIDPAE